MIRQSTYSRNGLTLFEVIMAMFIFLISIIAIWQLVAMGSERAMDIRQETRTSARCQAKMAEVIIGATELTSSGGYAYFDDSDSDLQWKVEAVESEYVGLFNVKVSVKKELPGRIIESQMCQIVLDPTIRGTSLERSNPPIAAPPPADPATTTTP